VEVSVYDLNGRVVAHFAGSGQAGVNTLDWRGVSDSGAPLQAGVYFIKLKSNTGTGMRKVMLLR
jgi:flagellar hook assembly protein FlgD